MGGVFVAERAMEGGGNPLLEEKKRLAVAGSASQAKNKKPPLFGFVSHAHIPELKPSRLEVAKTMWKRACVRAFSFTAVRPWMLRAVELSNLRTIRSRGGERGNAHGELLESPLRTLFVRVCVCFPLWVPTKS